MRITIQLTPEAAQAVRSPRSLGKKKSVLKWLKQPLRAVHAKTDDPLLAPFFEITIDDPAEATRVVERLQTDPAVNGAYIKPDEALPSS